MSISLPQRAPNSVAGDFYVEANLCTRCCLVHGEAPALLNDPEEPFESCFFRRQPETPEEVDQAISAICVTEVCALRYGGTDPDIIAKLRKRHMASVCDHTPEGQEEIKRRSGYKVPEKQDDAIGFRQAIVAIVAVVGLAVFFALLLYLFPQGG